MSVELLHFVPWLPVKYGTGGNGRTFHVIPATYKAEEMDELLAMPGTKVLMKTGKKMKEVKESILRSNQKAVIIENCGMPEEKIYKNAEEIPESAGYYSLIIVKE